MNGTTGTGDVVPLLTTLHGGITTHHRKHRSSGGRTKVGQHPPSPLSPVYWAESMMPDPIALSPLGCAHEERMRTYEVRSHLFCHPRNDCRGAYKASSAGVSRGLFERLSISIIISIQTCNCAHQDRMRTYSQPVALPSNKSCGQPVALSSESI